MAVAVHLMEAQASIASLKGAIETADPAEGEKIERLKAKVFAEFGATSLSGVCPRDPPPCAVPTVKPRSGSSQTPSLSACHSTALLGNAERLTPS